MHRSFRTTVAIASITAALVGGAATATAEPAAPAPVTLQPINVTTGGSSEGSAELAIQDIIKDPKWLLLPFILGFCAIGGSVSGGQVCFSPAM